MDELICLDNSLKKKWLNWLNAVRKVKINKTMSWIKYNELSWTSIPEKFFFVSLFCHPRQLRIICSFIRELYCFAVLFAIGIGHAGHYNNNGKLKRLMNVKRENLFTFRIFFVRLTIMIVCTFCIHKLFMIESDTPTRLKFSHKKFDKKKLEILLLQMLIFIETLEKKEKKNIKIVNINRNVIFYCIIASFIYYTHCHLPTILTIRAIIMSLHWL